MRLQLLDVHNNQDLIKSLYGLLMLLPQSEAFKLLRYRLDCIPHYQLATLTDKWVTSLYSVYMNKIYKWQFNVYVMICWKKKKKCRFSFAAIIFKNKWYLFLFFFIIIDEYIKYRKWNHFVHCVGIGVKENRPTSRS